MEKLTLTVDEFCECVGVGRTKAYELLRSDLEVVKIGRRTLVTMRSVKALIERSTELPWDPGP